MFFRVFFFGGAIATPTHRSLALRIDSSVRRRSCGPWTAQRGVAMPGCSLSQALNIEPPSGKLLDKMRSRTLDKMGCYSCWNRKKKGVVNPEQRDMI